MITATIDALSSPDWRDPDNLHPVYRIHEHDVTFYVGMTSWPGWTILELRGRGEYPWKEPAIAQLVRENEPHAGTWLVTLYTLTDCLPIVGIRDAATVDWYRPYTQHTGHTARASVDLAGDVARAALIRHYRPTDAPDT